MNKENHQIYNLNFAKTLIEWYLLNKRDLPWRKTKDPYLIYLSEVILQQTRVAQGLPYFHNFVKQYPTVQSLAKADENDILLLWQGLGYYSRARNMHQSAKDVVENYNGKFPETAKQLEQLKGVGSYTAAAIASFAYNEPIAVVDGNVLRVLSRVFGIEVDISRGIAKKIFQEKANSLLPIHKSDQFNQAIMEFGALQCVPKKPTCEQCVFVTNCVAFQTGKVSVLPFKSKKTKVTRRYLNYLIIEDIHQNTQIQKREGSGIWQNLYEFPVIETDAETIPKFLKKEIKQRVESTILNVSEIEDEAVIHKLSHQTLVIRFWSVRVIEITSGISISKVTTFPFPIVMVNFIKRYWKLDF